MPVLAISTEQPQLTNGLETIGVMLYPDNIEARDSFTAVVIAQMHLELDDDLEEVGVTKHLLRTVLNSHSMKDIYSDAAKQTRKGLTAGYILSALHGLHLLGAEEPSLRKAYYLVSQEYSEARTENGDKVGSSDTFLRNTFEPFRNVSHLWAAMDYLKGVVRADYGLGYDETLHTVLTNESSFRYLLSIAEQLRFFGESFATPREAKVVLDTKNTWKVPSDFPLLDPLAYKPKSVEWIQEKIKLYYLNKRDG